MVYCECYPNSGGVYIYYYPAADPYQSCCD
jgi:hypothetical protein